MRDSIMVAATAGSIPIADLSTCATAADFRQVGHGSSLPISRDIFGQLSKRMLAED